MKQIPKPSLKNKVKYKWWKHVCLIYRAYGSKPFTSEEADIATNHLPRRGMFAFMRNNKSLKLASGDMRAHYKPKIPRWQFTQIFLTYLQNGGLEELEEFLRDEDAGRVSEKD